MRIRQLESFVSVCETGSITQAAAALNIVQPALGAQISALEQELGVQLLERGPRGTTTTPAGQYFLEEAREILDRLATIRQTIKRFGPAEDRHLSIGLTSSLSALLAGPLAQELGRQNWPVKVQIVEDMSHVLAERAARGELDFALAFNALPHKGVKQTPVLRESVFFITGPTSEFNQEGPINLVELAKATFVIPTDKGQILQLLKQAMSFFNLPLNVAYQIESTEAIKGLIAQGNACAVLPFGTVKREVEAGTLIARKIANPPLVRTLFLLQPVGRPNSTHTGEALRIIEKFVAHLAGSSAFEIAEPLQPR